MGEVYKAIDTRLDRTAMRRLGLSVVCLLSAVGMAVAQPASSGADVPRTPWGTPDLQGVWDVRTITPLQRPADLADKSVLTEEEAREYATRAQLRRVQRRDRAVEHRDGLSEVDRVPYDDFWVDAGSAVVSDRRTSLIVDPPDGRIPPLTADAQERARRARETWLRPTRPIRERVRGLSPAHAPWDLGLSERCLVGLSSGPPFTPGGYNSNVQLFQTPDYVVILTEMVHQVRIVPLDGRPHLQPHIRQWHGNARGRWDGDTLVVDSTNFTDKTGSFSTAGVAMGSALSLHLVERFTRVDEDTLLYEFTVDDPVTFTRPFTAAIPIAKATGTLFEYACHEGNYAMINMLAGAREQERALTGLDPAR
jgi:hypothetical protein